MAEVGNTASLGAAKVTAVRGASRMYVPTTPPLKVTLATEVPVVSVNTNSQARALASLTCTLPVVGATQTLLAHANPSLHVLASLQGQSFSPATHV